MVTTKTTLKCIRHGSSFCKRYFGPLACPYLQLLSYYVHMQNSKKTKCATRS